MNELLEAVQGCEELSDEAAEQFYTYAYAQYKFGNFLQAAEVFRVLCARRALEARFWFGLGASCQEAKDYASALRAWAMAAIIDIDDPYPHFHAAECAVSMGNLVDATLAVKETEKRIACEKRHPLHERILTLKQTWKLSHDRPDRPD